MASNNQVYEIVTQRILDAIERGVAPWRIPWKKAPGSGLPRSMSTAKAYRGINVFLLGLQGFTAGYTSPWWGTYNHVSELGGQVRRGEKATPVVFWSVKEKHDDLDEQGLPERYFVLRYYRVFNAEQADGLPERFCPKAAEAEPASPSEAQARAEEAVGRYLARAPALTFTHARADRAYYSAREDLVNVPSLAEHRSADDYYSTVFHELAHSSGHPSRLGRPGVGEPHLFGDEEYSREELVAELASAMAQGTVGIESTVEPSAAYLKHWAKVLKGDPRLIVNAASAAQKAADYVLCAEADLGEVDGPGAVELCRSGAVASHRALLGEGDRLARQAAERRRRRLVAGTGNRLATCPDLSR
ncbi:MAG: ArdC-like ssDNA-binding domain-containing protein [Actinomycetota bacterium]|nr:ArdC-like ssDNA-binding domain-containing protein [Actinomycetota bacterium]